MVVVVVVVVVCAAVGVRVRVRMRACACVCACMCQPKANVTSLVRAASAGTYYPAHFDCFPNLLQHFVGKPSNTDLSALVHPRLLPLLDMNMHVFKPN